MKYSEYLRSDYWLSKREWFKKKAHNRCFICRCHENLHVHHKRYYRDGESILFRERRNDLRILCKDCHFTLHKLGIEKEFARNRYKRRYLRDWFKAIKSGETFTKKG